MEELPDDTLQAILEGLATELAPYEIMDEQLVKVYIREYFGHLVDDARPIQLGALKMQLVRSGLKR